MAFSPTTPPPITTTFAGAHAGHAAEQDALAAVRALEAMRAGLDRQPAGDLRHRRQQRQAAVAVGHRLVGDAHGAAGDQIAGLLRIGREMQIGEQDLAGAQHLPLDGLRLLDLDDHLGAGEDLARPSPAMSAPAAR